MQIKSLKERILDYLSNTSDFVNGGEIERLAMEKGFKASNASRRLRELAEEGVLEREERKGKKRMSVWYRYKRVEMPVYQRQLSLR